MIILLIFICSIFMVTNSYAAPQAPDLFSEYNKQINSEADAKSIEIYNAWADNMENLIEHKKRKGIVVHGKEETDKYSSDGLGNIIIKEGANIGTIINKTDIEDSTVILSNGNDGNRF